VATYKWRNPEAAAYGFCVVCGHPVVKEEYTIDTEADGAKFSLCQDCVVILHQSGTIEVSDE